MTDHEFIHGLAPLQANYRPCVATIGSFDGVHRGHQHLIAQIKQKAAKLGLPTMVMLFEPQPHEFFSKEQAPARLMRLREKVNALFEQGVNRVVCLKFNQQLRSLSANDYVEQVLVKAAGVKALVIGDDFRFGCDRAGDFALLKQAGESHGFTVTDSKTQLDTGERISSTRIRKLLDADNFAAAEGLLGRKYAISGRVVHGKQLGRKLGFPTMNIGLGRNRSPIDGVFTAYVRVLGEQSNKLRGVVNVGVRPTVGGRQKPILEVHVLDKTLDTYGKFVEVSFLSKLRGEQKFESVGALKAQIETDIEQARCFFDSRAETAA